MLQNQTFAYKKWFRLAAIAVRLWVDVLIAPRVMLYAAV